MNFIYNRRLDFHFILNDKVDKDKLIKSIKILNRKNKIIKLAKANITQSCTNKKIYIIIENNNFKELIQVIVNVLCKFQISELPPALEIDTDISYKKVKIHKIKRLGARFIRVERLVIE